MEWYNKRFELAAPHQQSRGCPMCLVPLSIPAKGLPQPFCCSYKPQLAGDISSHNVPAESEPSRSLTSVLEAWMLPGVRCEVGTWPESWSLLSCSRMSSSSRIFTLSTSHTRHRLFSFPPHSLYKGAFAFSTTGPLACAAFTCTPGALMGRGANYIPQQLKAVHQ